MTLLIEPAPGKLNLTLHVLGKRPDGYHELESLVAFAYCGEQVAVTPGPSFSLAVEGPFATAIDGQNLIARAVGGAETIAAEAGVRLTSGAFVLDKRLPVAAGIGGGSSDAAAALRLLRRLNPGLGTDLQWHELAASLGADVPVCVARRPAFMTGTGTRVEPLPRLPDAAVLLVNPRVPLATRDVFRALDAPPVVPLAAAPQPPVIADFADFCALLAAGRNDLEPVARRLCPPVAYILDRLRSLEGARLARLSGSGPTCFALFGGLSEAQSAARDVAAQHGHWWTAAAALS